jgi:hypothetical protein
MQDKLLQLKKGSVNMHGVQFCVYTHGIAFFGIEPSRKWSFLFFYTTLPRMLSSVTEPYWKCSFMLRSPTEVLAFLIQSPVGSAWGSAFFCLSPYWKCFLLMSPYWKCFLLIRALLEVLTFVTEPGNAIFRYRALPKCSLCYRRCPTVRAFFCLELFPEVLSFVTEPYRNCFILVQGPIGRVLLCFRFFLNIFLSDFLIFFVLYSAPLHLPPLRFHCADGCWDRTQDRCY